MAQSEKIRSKIATGNQMRHSEIHNYLTGIGAACRINGSHHVYTLGADENGKNSTTISIPRSKAGTAKAAYVKQLDQLLP